MPVPEPSGPAVAVNKVIVNNITIIDLTSDTITASNLYKGITAHDKSGQSITGTAEVTVSGEILIMPAGLVTVS